MKEVFSMWKYTKMIILVALTAAIYAAVLIPFKGGLVIIPGVTEVRPANALPVMFGVLFGPAGAWGAGIGNFIANVLGGTMGAGFIGELLGDLANFYLGFIGYKMWGVFFKKNEMTQTPNSLKKLLWFVYVSVLAAVVCAVIIGWYGDMFGVVPFAFLATIISVNNTIPELVVGIPLLILLYPRIKRLGLLWVDVMKKEDVSKGFAKEIGVLIMSLGGFGGLIVGILVSTQKYGQVAFQFAGTSGEVGVWLSVLPFILMIVIASFMLSGQEQFVDE